jgi:hypothetical protein
MKRGSISSNIINTLCTLPFTRRLPGATLQKTEFFKAAAVRTSTARGHIASDLQVRMVRSTVLQFIDHILNKKFLSSCSVNKYIRVENLFKVLRCM